MSSTLTTYSNNINTTYPYPGVDNDTQGFRDNFANIKNSLNVAAGEIGNLLQGAVKTTDTINDFNRNVIYKPTLQGEGYLIGQVTDTNSNSPVSGNVTVNLLDGSYQTMEVSGNTTVSFSNWPIGNGRIYGNVRLQVSNADPNTTSTVAFSGVKRDTSTSTYTLTTAMNTSSIFFDVWSPDNGSNVFLKYLGGPFV
jgi:hypothetical protein